MKVYKTSLNPPKRSHKRKCETCKNTIYVLPLWLEVLLIVVLTLFLYAPYGKTGLIFFIISWIIYEILFYSKIRFYDKAADTYIFKRRVILILISVMTWIAAREFLGYKRPWYNIKLEI